MSIDLASIVHVFAASGPPVALGFLVLWLFQSVHSATREIREQHQWQSHFMQPQPTVFSSTPQSKRSRCAYCGVSSESGAHCGSCGAPMPQKHG